jgi:hypothetical protein
MEALDFHEWEAIRGRLNDDEYRDSIARWLR